MSGALQTKRPSLGMVMRRRLSDITNSQPQTQISDCKKASEACALTEEHVNKLIMEKAALVRLLEEKNQIIELKVLECENLRKHTQQLQLQNWRLAQTNSQFLAEMNLARERLKALQHEFACKDALLKAKILESKEAGKEEKSLRDAPNPMEGVRKQHSRSQSMVPSITREHSSEKETVDTKRRRVRRQSARFSGPQDHEDYFEIEEINQEMRRKHRAAAMREDGRNSWHGTDLKEDPGESRITESLASRRSSTGRPARRASEKVQSYREIPLNVKMRRPA